MVNVIMGIKGTGKTKRLISMVREASEKEAGDVVCIEKQTNLMFDIPHSVRLICTADYSFGTYEYIKGFISGLHAGNYDITHIFIDSLYKMLDENNMEETEKFLHWCNEFSERENVKFTLTISEDEANAPESIKKYII